MQQVLALKELVSGEHQLLQTSQVPHEVVVEPALRVELLQSLVVVDLHAQARSHPQESMLHVVNCRSNAFHIFRARAPLLNADSCSDLVLGGLDGVRAS